MKIICECIYHHHHIMPPARISLTLSRHSSLSFIASGRSQSCCMLVRAGRPAFARPWGGPSIGEHHLWARLCFPSSGVLHVWYIYIYIYIVLCIIWSIYIYITEDTQNFCKSKKNNYAYSDIFFVVSFNILL